MTSTRYFPGVKTSPGHSNAAATMFMISSLSSETSMSNRTLTIAAVNVLRQDNERVANVPRNDTKSWHTHKRMCSLSFEGVSRSFLRNLCAALRCRGKYVGKAPGWKYCQKARLCCLHLWLYRMIERLISIPVLRAHDKSPIHS